jgi:hypothetical protein
MTFFNASVRFILGNGETFLFWTDPWLYGTWLSDLVATTLSGMSWTRDIRGALTIPVLMQYVLLF